MRACRLTLALILWGCRGGNARVEAKPRKRHINLGKPPLYLSARLAGRYATLCFMTRNRNVSVPFSRALDGYSSFTKKKVDTVFEYGILGVA